MSDNNNYSANSSGVALMSLLFILLFMLKLLNVTVVTTWSWWWVTAPLWAPTALALGILAIFGAGAAIIAVVTR
jgi:hypothetical protein